MSLALSSGSSLALSKIIKEYLDPEMTHSLFFDENSTFNVYTEPDLLRRISPIRDAIVNTVICRSILPTLFDCPPLHGNDKKSGVAGDYITFESKNMHQGFIKLMESMKIYRPVRKTKVLQDNFPTNAIGNVSRAGTSYGSSSAIGVKVQVLPTTIDKYYEAKCIREERILERLNESSFASFVPKLYFGCTTIFPINSTDTSQVYTISVRLTFLQHLGGYENLRNYFSRQVEANRPIRDETITAIKQVLINLWKQGISHNDFAAQNMMINLHDDTDIKLLDFGLATMLDFSRLRNVMRWEDMHQQYIEHYEKIKRKERRLGVRNATDNTFFDNEGSNVRKMNELLNAVLRTNLR